MIKYLYKIYKYVQYDVLKDTQVTKIREEYHVSIEQQHSIRSCLIILIV